MQKIRKILKKLLRLLEKRLSLVVLMIFAVIILYASWILYNFAHKSISRSPEISFEKVEINKATFERAIEYIDAREQNILEIMGKEYRDVFK